MANTDGPKGFRFVRSLAGEVSIERILMAASQTIAKGDALELSAGTAIIATATSGLILGVAAESKTSTASGSVYLHYYPAVPWAVFRGQTNSTYTSTTHDQTEGDIQGTTGIMELNEAGTTEDVVHFLGLADGTTDAASNAKVDFIFIRSSYLPLLALKA